MSILHTEIYDQQLISGLPHLQNYPEMKPFIGTHYPDACKRILILAESHYIPGEELALIPNKTHLTDWYNNKSDCFYKGFGNYINTRMVIDKSDKMMEEGFNKHLLIYHNVKKELKNCIPTLKNEQYVFPHFSVYNYFQRPAFKVTQSIDNNKIDDNIAFETLKFITSLLDPQEIIFVSMKAKRSFDRISVERAERAAFANIAINAVPHASCAWWHKQSRSYGNLTGRQRFINIFNQNVA